MGIPSAIITFLRAVCPTRAELAVETLARREQRAVLQRSVQRPRLRRRDRIFWTWVLRIWSRWKSARVIVQPETVSRWHRQGCLKCSETDARLSRSTSAAPTGANPRCSSSR